MHPAFGVYVTCPSASITAVPLAGARRASVLHPHLPLVVAGQGRTSRAHRRSSVAASRCATGVMVAVRVAAGSQGWCRGEAVAHLHGEREDVRGVRRWGERERRRRRPRWRVPDAGGGEQAWTVSVWLGSGSETDTMPGHRSRPRSPGDGRRPVRSVAGSWGAVTLIVTVAVVQHVNVDRPADRVGEAVRAHEPGIRRVPDRRGQHLGGPVGRGGQVVRAVIPMSLLATGMSTLRPDSTVALSLPAWGKTVTLTAAVPQLAGSTFRHAYTVNWSRPVKAPTGSYVTRPFASTVPVPSTAGVVTVNRGRRRVVVRQVAPRPRWSRSSRRQRVHRHRWRWLLDVDRCRTCGAQGRLRGRAHRVRERVLARERRVRGVGGLPVGRW